MKKVLGFIIGAHIIRCFSEYMYFKQCAGLWTSLFSWNSPTCRGLRWVSDSVTATAVSRLSVTALQLIKDLRF